MKIAAPFLLSLTLSACGGGGGSDPSAPSDWKPAHHRGGSNFNWYAGECDGGWWDDYHTLKQFDENETISQLSAMYTIGQRSLSLSVFFSTSAPANTGSHVGIGAGGFPDWYVDNLLRTLQLAREMGFERFVVRFHPVGDYGRDNATPDMAPAAHNAMVHLVSAVEKYTGIRPYVNLCNECIEDGKPTEFPAALWDLAHDDPNFSGRAYIGITGGNFEVSGLERVYGGRYPRFQGITLYNGPHSGALDKLPDASQIIVDESHFNGAETAQALRSGTYATGKRVQFVTQWPLTEAARCKHVDRLPILEYDKWIEAGF